MNGERGVSDSVAGRIIVDHGERDEMRGYITSNNKKRFWYMNPPTHLCLIIGMKDVLRGNVMGYVMRGRGGGGLCTHPPVFDHPWYE